MGLYYFERGDGKFKKIERMSEKLQKFENIRNLIIENKQEEALSCLLLNPELSTYQDSNGTTLLHFCAISNQIELAKYILKNGQHPYVLDNSGQPPVRWAMDYENDDFLKFYVSEGLKCKKQLNFPYPTRSPLCFAIQSANLFLVKSALDLGFFGSSFKQVHDAPFSELARISRKNQWGYKSVTLTKFQRKNLVNSIADMLLEARIDPLESDDKGDTAFFLAAHFENIPLLNWFVERGYSAFPRNNNNETPFFMAVRDCKFLTINWYLEHSNFQIDILERNFCGKNVIEIARDGKQYGLVSLMEEYLFRQKIKSIEESSQKCSYL